MLRSSCTSRFGIDPTAPTLRKVAHSVLLLIAAAMIGVICLALGSMVSMPLAITVGAAFAMFVCSGLAALWIPADCLTTFYQAMESIVVWAACLCLVILTAWLLIKTFAH